MSVYTVLIYNTLLLLWLTGIATLALVVTRELLSIFFNFDFFLWLTFQVFRLKIWINPKYLTAKRIRVLPQFERDYAIERFSYGRFIGDIDIVPINIDDRYGSLYKFNILNEGYTVVCVLNSSPEADNTYKYHYIRVPNDIRTAHQAVAWTFHMSDFQYDPDIET